MDLGQFSVSLAVEDLPTSRAFYNKLGFEVFNSEVFESGKGGSEFNEKWVILTNGNETIGLFQDMFEKNILAWNPTDVRSVQKALKEEGMEFMQEAEEEGTGPTSAIPLDPDGNPILLDQHND